MSWIEVQRHLVALLRGDAIAQLFVERLAYPVEGVYPLLGVLRQLGDAGHVFDGLRRVVGLLVELCERLERRDVRVLEVDDVLVGVDGAFRVLDFVREHLRDGTVELDLRLSLAGRGDVAVVGVHEIEPLPELAVVSLELVVSLFVVGIDLEDLFEPLRGEIRLQELVFVQRREVRQDFDLFALGRDDLELLFENRDQVGPLLEDGVDAR